MAFAVNLYIIAKKRNSTALPPGNPLPTMCEFKEVTSLVNPQIYIAPIAGAAVSTFNYCRIQELGRYYWITECTWENGRYLLSLSVDVLATYKASIGASSQYVARSSAAYNTYLRDTMYPRTEQISTAQLILGQNVNQSLQDGVFIMGLISPKNSITGCVTYYVLNWQAVVVLRQQMLTDLQWTGVTDITDELLQTLFNPFQYIVSFKWFPLSPPAAQMTAVTDIDFGYWTFSISGIQGAAVALFVPSGLPTKTGLKYSVAGSSIPNHPAISRGRYLNGSGFADYYLMLTSYGKMALPNESMVAGVGLSIYETVDFMSGESILNVYLGAGTNETMSPVLTAQSHIGIDLPFGSSDVDVLRAGASAVSAVSGTVGGLLTGNIGSGITSLANGISDVAHELSPTIQMGGSSGSFVTFGEFGGVDQIQAVFHAVANDDNADIGRPLCEVRTISALGGYMECINAHCPIMGTLGEQEEVERFLNDGFYYE